MILLLGAASLVDAWFVEDTDRQFRVLQTLQTAALVVLTLLLWLLFASRLPRRVRLAVLGVVVALAILGKALCRIRGVTGDVVPIDMLKEWIDESYRAIAPKKLLKELDAAS